MGLNASDDFMLKTNFTVKSEGPYLVVEIEYTCNEIGGSLINIDFSFEVDQCGDKFHIYWDKLCGNPIGNFFLLFYRRV